jgi:hypothetical protein
MLLINGVFIKSIARNGHRYFTKKRNLNKMEKTCSFFMLDPLFLQVSFDGWIKILTFTLILICNDLIHGIFLEQNAFRQ